jgi:hypothetical protein
VDAIMERKYMWIKGNKEPTAKRTTKCNKKGIIFKEIEKAWIKGLSDTQQMMSRKLRMQHFRKDTVVLIVKCHGQR